MDSFEACKIMFLDLSDVEERERAEVLNSLYSENSNVKLPWKVPQNPGGHKTVADTICGTSYNDSYAEPVHHHPNNFQPAPEPKIYQYQEYTNAAYPHQNYLPQVNYQLPQPQYVLYPSYSSPPITALPPTFHPYPIACAETLTMISETTYPTTQIHPDNFVPLNYAPDNFYQPNCSEANAPYEAPPPATETWEEPEIPRPEAKENGVAEAPAPPQEAEPVRAAPKEEPAPVQAGNKSWASLFNRNKTLNAPNDAGDKQGGSFNLAVNKETNNNDETCPLRNPRRSKFIDPICYRMGEFLINHNVDAKTISLQPKGLINRSSYCYINSILQALLACPPAYNLFVGLSEQNTSSEKEKATPIIDGICRFVKEFQHLPAGQRVNRRNDKTQKRDHGVTIDCDLPFEPSYIYKIFTGKNDSFLVEGRQEDAEEFLGCLLNGLNDEMVELMKLVNNDLSARVHHEDEADKEWQVMGPKNKGGITRQIDLIKTPISNLFGGFLKSRIYRAGDSSTYNIQPFFTLQLNIEKVKTVREALEALVTKNQLEGVTSEKTNEEVEAWQQVTLEELPLILVLHLKCFDFKLDGCTKIIKALEFPIDLKIDSKLLSSKTVGPKEKQYKLFAVVYHDGKEATKGHYITDAFHVGYSSWLRYDDASVKPVQEQHVLTPQGTRVPYLLFYRRSDTIRSK